MWREVGQCMTATVPRILATILNGTIIAGTVVLLPRFRTARIFRCRRAQTTRKIGRDCDCVRILGFERAAGMCATSSCTARHACRMSTRAAGSEAESSVNPTGNISPKITSGHSGSPARRSPWAAFSNIQSCLDDEIALYCFTENDGLSSRMWPTAARAS
jgi:hypothetical protein